VGNVQAEQYCDENNANCLDASSLLNVNVGEDSYGGEQTGTPADSCNGNTTSKYTCSTSTTQNCTDRYRVPYSYTCGGKGQNTCTGYYTNRYRTIDCKRARVFVNG